MKPLFSTQATPIAALAVVLTAPIPSHADQAVDACINAFVQSTLPKGQPVKIRKVDGTRHPTDWYGTTRQVQIVAHVSRTGERVAQATCTVDGNDRVVALNGAAPRPRVASALENTAAR